MDNLIIALLMIFGFPALWAFTTSSSKQDTRKAPKLDTIKDNSGWKGSSI